MYIAKQIRITLSDTLHQHLQQKAEKYGLTMAGYVKNLIIQDIKNDGKSVITVEANIDESVKKKKRFSWKGIDLMDG